MHLIVIILGFTGVLGKLIDSGSTILVWYRMAIAFVVLFIFIAIKGNLFQISKANFYKVLATGVVVALHWLFFFESIKVSNVSVAVVCMATSSLFSAFLEPLILKRKIIKQEIVFGVIVVIALSYAMNSGAGYYLGYIYGVIAAFLATLFTILNAIFIHKVDATKITMIEMLGGSLVITTFLFFNDSLDVNSLYISKMDLIYLLILGIVCTAFAFVVSVEVMKQLSPYSVIMAVNLEPVYSVILALLLFEDSESMSYHFYIGASVIILTVFFEGYLKTKKSK